MSSNNTRQLSNEQKELIKRVFKVYNFQAISKQAFLKLYHKGCDPEILASAFIIVTSKSKFKIKETVRVKGKSEITRTYSMSIHYWDTLEETLGGFEKLDINSLKKKILDIAKGIEKLNYTHLAKHLSSNYYDAKIQTLPEQLRCYANDFIPLLIQESKNVGKRNKPVFKKHMNHLLDYVETATGKPNYKLICDVLNELGVEWDEGALKQWRNRHKGGAVDVT
jgi:hypothetical protein